MAQESAKTGAGKPRNLARRVMPPFAALRTFEAVGFLGGIRRAALELGIDHAAVSRQLRALEAWAGVRLVDRQRRGLLTDAGTKYHARVSAALEEISQATLDLTRRGDDRALTIWCTPGLASRWLGARLAGFADAHPELDIEVRPTDCGPDFSRQEADADIRYVRDFAAAPDPDILHVKIAPVRVMVVASPELAAKLPSPLGAVDLLDAPLLHERDDYGWRRWFAAHGVEPPARLPGPRLGQAHLTLDAARRGQGIAISNRLLLADDVLTESLARLPVTPEAENLVFGAYVLRVRRDRLRNPGIAKFRRWLEREIALDAHLNRGA